MTTKATKRKRVEAWFNIYEDGTTGKGHSTRRAARIAAGPQSVPVVNVLRQARLVEQTPEDSAELRALRRVARAAKVFMRKHGDHCPDCDVQRNTPQDMSGCSCPGDTSNLDDALAALKKARKAK